MDMSSEDFQVWYDTETDGKSKIAVVGKVSEIDGSSTTLVRAEPQGINPRILMLKIHVEPYKGPFPPHLAFEKEIRYEEPAENGAFTDVNIERKDGCFTLKIDQTSL
ncbi:MAG: hypothetical protein ACYCUJ_10105 [Acidithiobacillus sp.]|jgi:hypothetical protein